MKTLYLFLAIGFLVSLVKARSALEKNAQVTDTESHPSSQVNDRIKKRSPIVCRSRRGNCRYFCQPQERSVGQCLPDIHCCFVNQTKTH